MTKLLKHSVLALALVLGATTYAHAESVVMTHVGINGTFEEILHWIFPFLFDHHAPNSPGPGSGNTKVVPEIDPGMAMSGLMLLGGTLTVLRSRRNRRPGIN